MAYLRGLRWPECFGRHHGPVSDLVLILRYRKAVTYGFHVLLGALETHATALESDEGGYVSSEQVIQGDRSVLEVAVAVEPELHDGTVGFDTPEEGDMARVVIRSTGWSPR